MMEFIIDQSPPSTDEITGERGIILAEIKQIKKRDTILSFIFIVVVSAITGLAIFWTSNNLTYSLIAVSGFPIVAVVLNFAGITTNMGFRSAANRLNDLNHALVALTPISDDNSDITNLCDKYKEVGSYRKKTKDKGRPLVNGELAMFWDWDSSTMAKQDKARGYVEMARKSMTEDIDVPGEGEGEDTA